MMQDAVGEHGINAQELDGLTPKLAEIATKLQQTKPSFTKLAYDSATADQVTALAEQTTANFENLLVLGIGGSDLGARAIMAALASPYRNFEQHRNGMRVFFLGGNTDPQEITDVLSQVDLKKTTINIISKSGDTIEPMSAFVFLRDKLVAEVGQENHAKHIIATTDVAKGTMREITDKWGYQSLIVPANVGGRFSVLSTVGLFPAACAGIDVRALLAGAAAMDESISQAAENNIALLYAALHYLGYRNHNQNIHIVMPYAERLRQFGFWYRQLWAESLGKKESSNGEVINTGPTPVAALGATDQHSQMQLYNDGPFDKLLTFIRVEKFDQNYKIPKPLEDLEGVTYMAGHDFAEIINTEAKASAIALAQNGRPNGTLVVPELTAHTLGELFMLFEWGTAYMGELLAINSYNQPGVEAGKTAMYALLGRDGFTDKKNEFERFSTLDKCEI